MCDCKRYNRSWNCSGDVFVCICDDDIDIYGAMPDVTLLSTGKINEGEMHMIEIKNLTKVFKNYETSTVALDHVDLTVE